MLLGANILGDQNMPKLWLFAVCTYVSLTQLHVNFQQNNSGKCLNWLWKSTKPQITQKKDSSDIFPLAKKIQYIYFDLSRHAVIYQLLIFQP